MLQLRQRGQGRKGTAESVRVTVLNDCILEHAAATNPIRVPVCPPPPTIPDKETPDQFTRTLNTAVACPILYTNTPGAGCQPVYTAPIPPLPGTDVQGPAAAQVYRHMATIYSTDQIARVATTPAGSFRTAQIKAGIVAASQTRYAQVIIPRINPCAGFIG